MSAQVIEIATGEVRRDLAVQQAWMGDPTTRPYVTAGDGPIPDQHKYAVRFMGETIPAVDLWKHGY